MSYNDTVTLENKGLEVEHVKILTIYTSIDVSCNQFEGNIPEARGKLKMLYLLNLSHNALTGSIPSSIGNMRQLEALNFSVNKLGGTIPTELANLTFPSYLNLSYNKLSGRIPTAAQFSTFEKGSFKGSKGLCWTLSSISCDEAERKPPSGPENDQSSSDNIEWDKIFAEIGFSVGLCIVVNVISLLFCKRWRRFYYQHIYRALTKIFRKKIRDKEEGTESIDKVHSL
ncbi:receptor-like protein 34 [Daucus carota subsp. sativus]|uniref:receptor-like protein 34 n=1 Tax=Daucus carota subsp. sativus TaxID=79200 RepID=UPI003083061D